MKNLACLLAVFLLFVPVIGAAQAYVGSDGTVKVVVIKDPYSDSRTGPELLKGPDHLEAGGLNGVLTDLGCDVVKTVAIKMPDELEREYGEWNRAAHTNRVTNKTISESDLGEHFFIGLLSGSKSLVGMLGGLQHLGPGRQPIQDNRGRDIPGLVRLGDKKPLKVGLLWIDSKGAFNTPDITLEGNMGGMNVAVAAGLCAHNLRIQAGLNPHLSTKYIVMAGVRNTNPYEDVAIDESFIEKISVAEIKSISSNVHTQMERLSQITDVIYVHVDLSVLDPAELPGHPEAYPGGPSSGELAAFLTAIFKYEKTAAIGIASMQEEAEETTIKAAYRLIEGAIQGVKSR
jgi:arginase family enzyme